MSKTRDLHTASIVVGRKGTGKSTLTNKIALSYSGDKVLILDVNGSAAYNGVKEISIDQVKLLRRGVVKISGTPTIDTLKTIAKEFRNGLVIFEDCTKYIKSNPQVEIREFLVDHRMMGCDLIFTFHALKFVPPFFWAMISYLQLLKTQEILEKSDERRYPNFKELSAAFNRINAHKDNYYSETIATYI